MLGRGEYRVNPLGFSARGLGGDSWLDVDPRDVQRTLYEALDAGIDFVDTARADGDGAAEKLIGEVIRDLRARDWCVVATKVPPLGRSKGRVAPAVREFRSQLWTADPASELSDIFPSDHVIHSVEQSLRALRAEVLGIAQLQVWHDSWLAQSAWPELRSTMQRLIQQGKVLRWGVSVGSGDSDENGPASAMAILDDPLIATVQTVYNIHDPRAAGELFARARDNQVGVIARCPFDEGALTGALHRETVFPEGDFRAGYFRGERLIQAVERAESLAALCGERARTLAELSLRFCLSHPDVAVTIPGMRRSEHLRANLAAAAQGPLSADILARLSELAWDKNWYR